MYAFIFWVSLFFFVVVVGLMCYFVFKYRRKDTRLPEKSPSHHTGLELAWTILPSFLLVYMFVAGAFGYLNMRTIPERATAVERTIDVKAFKYGWQFIYPNGDISSELHLAKDVPVRFRLKAEDALHSFYIREFRVKMDCVPGRYTECWVTPRMSRTPDQTITADGKKGNLEPFHLACTEYCGEGHSQMRTEWKENADGTGSWAFPVYVHDCSFEELVKFTQWKPAEHTRWESGQFYFKAYGCVGCHAIENATQKVGPNFMKANYGIERQFEDGTTAVINDQYLRESINYSTAKVVKGYPNQMPKFNFNEEQLAALIDFIRSPSEDPTPNVKLKDLANESPNSSDNPSADKKSDDQKKEQ